VTHTHTHTAAQVVTNLLGIVTVPYTLRLVLSSSGGTAAVSVEPQALVVKLLLTVLVPTVLGKLARDFIPPVCRFVTRYKTQLSMFSTLNLAAIVWQTLSGARDTLLRQVCVWRVARWPCLARPGVHVVCAAAAGGC
jgi:sodium/bile acid cotransporter 7